MARVLGLGFPVCVAAQNSGAVSKAGLASALGTWVCGSRRAWGRGVCDPEGCALWCAHAL